MTCAVKCKTKKKSKPVRIQIGTLAEKARVCGGIVVAYGGGTDSTGMLVEIVRLGIPIRAILFADTGGELPRTYAFVKLFSFWLTQKGYPAITWVRNTPSRGTNKGIPQDLFANLWRNQTLPPVAFNFHTCSERFKIRPQQAWIQSQDWAQETWSQKKRILQLVGFESDEGYRINRTHPLIEKSGKFSGHYPLVEWGWTRARCEAAILEAGLPLPGKSACFFCPMRKEAEIAQLASEEPALFEKALALEDRALQSGKIRNPEIRGLGGRKLNWNELAKKWRKTEVA
jgi:3'-phosphoadenosine 5'-phosphosulfate sulfotransferase (PAPS reductase)/FAD synthetase